MKRTVVSMAVLALILATPTALATNNSSSTQNHNYPPPYTGGAPVAKYFHLSDGSTMTITTTGAVIKQSRNATPYRQGWVNPDDIGHIHSFHDLKGRLAYGDTNPYRMDNPHQTQTKHQPQPQPQPSSTSTSTTSNPPSVSQSTTVIYSSPAPQPAPEQPTQVTKVIKQEYVKPASTIRTLPSTGAGGVAAMASVATVLGTTGHYIYTRRG